MQCSVEFRKLWTDPEDLEIVGRAAETIYAVSRDLELLFINDGWDAFARANAAPADFERHWRLGGSIAGALASPSGQRALLAIDSAFETGEPQTIDYECSSPSHLRLLRATFQPVAVDERGPRACLISHVVRIETPHDDTERVAHENVVARYTAANGVVTQCSECRCVRRVSEGAWDWVPDLLTSPPALVSHGLCASCFSKWVTTPTTSPGEVG